MDVTIQFESHRVELPFIYEAEYDSQVLEYYDQPPSIPLVYRAVNGRRLSVMHTPDYFVLREGSACWIECKTRGGSRSACQPESQSLFSRRWRQVALYPR
jgi:putative transposase